MEEIEVVIKIDKDIYKARQHWVANPKRMVDEVDIAIANGTPLPKGHGKLIDAEKFNDAIYERFEGIQFYEGTGYDVYSDLKESIENSPTIIEADKEEA